MNQPTELPYKREWHRDLDWLCVIAVLLLVPFHSALIFILDPGLVAYVKDTVPGAFLVPLKDFLDHWQLELLFCIAGAASWFALLTLVWRSLPGRALSASPRALHGRPA